MATSSRRGRAGGNSVLDRALHAWHRPVAVLLGLPASLAACPVCFGGDNPDLSNAFWWGVVILLGFTMSILGALGYAIWRIEKLRPAPPEPGSGGRPKRALPPSPQPAPAEPALR